MCENLKCSGEFRSHLKELNVWEKNPEPKPNQNKLLTLSFLFHKKMQ